MSSLKDVCRYIRSKNAGPFWVTIDIFFADEDLFRRFRADPSISTGAIASLYGVPAEEVRRFEVDMFERHQAVLPAQGSRKAACWSGTCTAGRRSSRCWTWS